MEGGVSGVLNIAEINCEGEMVSFQKPGINNRTRFRINIHDIMYYQSKSQKLPIYLNWSYERPKFTRPYSEWSYSEIQNFWTEALLVWLITGT